MRSLLTECPLGPGDRPYLVNPRPGSAFRQLAVGLTCVWTFRELYGPVAPAPLQDRLPLEELMEKLGAWAEANRRWSVAYLTDGRAVGAVAFDLGAVPRFAPALYVPAGGWPAV
jgi:hypothetical protein